MTVDSKEESQELTHHSLCDRNDGRQATQRVSALKTMALVFVVGAVMVLGCEGEEQRIPELDTRPEIAGIQLGKGMNKQLEDLEARDGDLVTDVEIYGDRFRHAYFTPSDVFAFGEVMETAFVHLVDSSAYRTSRGYVSDTVTYNAIVDSLTQRFGTPTRHLDSTLTYVGKQAQRRFPFRLEEAEDPGVIQSLRETNHLQATCWEGDSVRVMVQESQQTYDFIGAVEESTDFVEQITDTTFVATTISMDLGAGTTTLAVDGKVNGRHWNPRVRAEQRIDRDIARPNPDLDAMDRIGSIDLDANMEADVFVDPGPSAFNDYQLPRRSRMETDYANVSGFLGETYGAENTTASPRFNSEGDLQYLTLRLASEYGDDRLRIDSRLLADLGRRFGEPELRLTRFEQSYRGDGMRENKYWIWVGDRNYLELRQTGGGVEIRVGRRDHLLPAGAESIL